MTRHPLYTWRIALTVNSANATLRQKVGYALRTLASLIDGRISIGIGIFTTPDIGRARKIACINRGLDVITRAVESEVQHAAAAQADSKNGGQS